MSLKKIEGFLESHGWTRKVAGDADFDAALLAIGQMAEARKGLIVSGEYGVGNDGEASVLHGANLDGASVRYTYRDMDEGEKSFDVPASELAFEDGLVKVSEAFWDGEWFDHADNSFGGIFKVTTTGGSAERHVSYYE